MSAPQYDLVVIGSGPAGQKGAICAAKLRKRVAVIDHTLTIGSSDRKIVRLAPSKTWSLGPPVRSGDAIRQVEHETQSWLSDSSN